MHNVKFSTTFRFSKNGPIPSLLHTKCDTKNSNTYKPVINILIMGRILSKTEKDFISNPESFKGSKSYKRKLKFKAKQNIIQAIDDFNYILNSPFYRKNGRDILSKIVNKNIESALINLSWPDKATRRIGEIKRHLNYKDLRTYDQNIEKYAYRIQFGTTSNVNGLVSMKKLQWYLRTFGFELAIIRKRSNTTCPKCGCEWYYPYPSSLYAEKTRLKCPKCKQHSYFRRGKGLKRVRN